MSDSNEVGQPIIQYVPVILNNGTDNSGFPGLVTSSDNGVTRVLEYTADGKMYHQRDVDRIAKIPFDEIRMKSPSGTVFSFAVDDEGNLKGTKVGDNK